MRILPEILKTLESREHAVLATILTTSGSTPASAFSKMIVFEDSTAIGTVGGGCMEADVKAAAKDCFVSNRSRILTFNLTEDEFVQGLICGGTVEILIESLNPEHTRVYRSLDERSQDGNDCLLATRIDPEGRVVEKFLLAHDEKQNLEAIPGVSFETIEKTFRRGETQRITASNGDWILEPVAGAPRLIVFGAGHVSRVICKSASAVGFRVVVVDDRAEYANLVRFPDASEILVEEFSETFDKLAIRNSDYVVIATRGHRYDEEILEEALRYSPKYIGMIGSQRKVLTTFKHLISRGVSAELLNNVCSPMGLEIGAATPEEIAVSVTAELIAVRRGVSTKHVAKSTPLLSLLAALPEVKTDDRASARLIPKE